jgi:hypothetical protein
MAYPKTTLDNALLTTGEADQVDGLSAITLAGDDRFLVEDDTDGSLKKVNLTALGAALPGTDATAIHEDVAGEIAAVAAKATPVAADNFLIEDSEDSDAKASATLGTIPVAGVIGGTLAETTLDDGAIDGGKLATAASGAVAGTGLCVHWITLTSGANGDQTIVVDDKIQVIGFECIPNGAGTAGSEVTLKNGSTAITDAVDLNIADNTIARAATIDDAQSTVDAAGTLTFSKASSGGNFPGARAIVYSIRMA